MLAALMMSANSGCRNKKKKKKKKRKEKENGEEGEKGVTQGRWSLYHDAFQAADSNTQSILSTSTYIYSTVVLSYLEACSSHQESVHVRQQHCPTSHLQEYYAHTHYCTHTVLYYCLYLERCSSTRNPSTSGSAASSLQFAAFTEPAGPRHGQSDGSQVVTCDWCHKNIHMKLPKLFMHNVSHRGHTVHTKSVLTVHPVYCSVLYSTTQYIQHSKVQYSAIVLRNIPPYWMRVAAATAGLTLASSHLRISKWVCHTAQVTRSSVTFSQGQVTGHEVTEGGGGELGGEAGLTLASSHLRDLQVGLPPVTSHKSQVVNVLVQNSTVLCMNAQCTGDSTLTPNTPQTPSHLLRPARGWPPCPSQWPKWARYTQHHIVPAADLICRHSHKSQVTMSEHSGEKKKKKKKKNTGPVLCPPAFSTPSSPPDTVRPKGMRTLDGLPDARATTANGRPASLSAREEERGRKKEKKKEKRTLHGLQLPPTTAMVSPASLSGEGLPHARNHLQALAQRARHLVRHKLQLEISEKKKKGVGKDCYKKVR